MIVRSGSTTLSLRIGTANVRAVTPGMKVRTPDVAV